MAKKPIFITGANAKLKIGGTKTLAYAQDVSYNVSVDVVPVETMGRYEAVTVEPVNYSVSGEFSIVRYTKQAVDANAGIDNPSAKGNGVGAMALSSHVDPKTLIESETFDLEIYQKGAGANDNKPVVKVKDCRITRIGGGLNKRGILIERVSYVGILHEDDSFSVGNSGDSDLQ
jgi:hypothetical protein